MTKITCAGSHFIDCLTEFAKQPEYINSGITVRHDDNQ